MKLLLDMNLSPRWVNVLTDNGYEALHWSTDSFFGVMLSYVVAPV
jgi:predicted nuclease of predicted toxin-antitoxin system